MKKIKSEDLISFLREHPGSEVVVSHEGWDTRDIKKLEVAVWADNGKGERRSTYTEKEVRYHERQKNDIGPLKKLRVPQLRLVIPKH